MQLWALNLFFSGVNMPIRLMFKEEATAKAAAVAPLGMDGLFLIHDDFGTECRAPVVPAARTLTCVVEELEANIEMSLLQARAQHKVQKRAQQDPMLSGGGSIIGAGGGGPVLPFQRPQ